MPDLGEVVKQTLAQKRAAEAKGERFSPPSTPSSSTLPPQDSSQQQTKPRSQSSSSTNRPPPITPPFATAPLSPYYTDSTSVNTTTREPNSPLGLDHPRPKHRTQASYDWFGDFKQQGGFEQPKQPRQEGWESPNGGTLRGQNDVVRTESPASTHHDNHNNTEPVTSPAPPAPTSPAPTNNRKRTETSARGASYPTTTSADSDEEGEGNLGGGDNGSDLPKRTLRGAFTAEDFDRGQKKIQYGEGATGVTTGSKHTGAGSKMMRKVLHPGHSSSSGTEKKKGGMGGGLTRSSSAGEGSRSPGGTQMEGSQTIDGGRARSLRSRNGGDDEDWQEDEERDQFDTDAPAGPRSISQARRPTSSSGKKNSWAKLRTAAAANGGGGDHSGTSTPREHSDDEGASERPGPGAKRPSNANARRGSAWEVVRKRLGGGDERKKQKARQGASLTGHELISVCPAPCLLSLSVTDSVRHSSGTHYWCTTSRPHQDGRHGSR